MKARGLTDNHPDVIAAKNQIAILRSQGGSGGSARLQHTQSAYSSLQSMQAERQAAVTALNARKSQLQGDMASLARSNRPNRASLPNMPASSQDYEVLADQYDKLVWNATISDCADRRKRRPMRYSSR